MSGLGEIDDIDFSDDAPSAEVDRPLRSRPTRLDIFDDMDLKLALFRATTAVQRLEAFSLDPVAAKMATAWSRRKEALAIAVAADRASAFEEAVAGMGGEILIDINSKGDRLASDVLEAMTETSTIDGAGILDVDIRSVWEIADQSNIKVSTGDASWRIERDCVDAAEGIKLCSPHLQPWGASEALRRLWLSDRFDGIGQRMTLILAAPLVRAGFGVRSFSAGIAGEIMAEAERREEIFGSEDDFFVLFCRGVERSANAAREAGQRLQRLAIEFERACGRQREGSRTSAAIAAVLSFPILTPQALMAELGTTDRGAEFILDKLLSAGCIVEHDTSTKRNRTFVCKKSLTLSI